MERTRSISQNLTTNAVDFTVHNYVQHNLSRPTTSDLLEQGHKIILLAGSKSKGWVSLKPLEIIQLPKKKSRVYEYALSCLRVRWKGKQKVVNNELKEWGSPPDDSEIFNLGDLEEFVSADLKPVFDRPQSAPLTPIGVQVRERESSVERPRKRRKLDYGPLHGLLPQPHIHPSSSIQLRRSPKICSYRKTKPIVIPPYTIPLPPPSEYDRTAWLIPVRGTLPWEHCSSASIFDRSQQIPLMDADENQIYWSHSALDAFWVFLLKLKDTGSVGSLGVSFHASSSYQSDTSSFDPSTCSQPTFNPSQQLLMAETGTSDRSAHILRIALSTVDYIKVYQETLNAMYVRTALDAWAYNVKDDDNGSSETERPVKVRVLKGARLVLVDARSKGMLIS